MTSRENRKSGVVVTTIKTKAKGSALRWVLGMVSFSLLLIVLVVVVGGFAVAVELIPTSNASSSNCLSSLYSVVPPAAVAVGSTNVGIGGQPLSSGQRAIAETIIGIGINRQVIDPSITVQDITTVLAIGIQESHLTNPPGGTGNSLGVFQQTPPAWGTPEQIMDVGYATNTEYDHLLSVQNRSSKSMLEVALDIQRPNPAAYNSPNNNFELDSEPLALALMAAVGQPNSNNPNSVPVQSALQPVCIGNPNTNGQTVSGNGLSAGGSVNPAACLTGDIASDQMAELAIEFACSVLGTPYLWGGQSEANGFDCSGLVWWAFGQAGFPVGSRTSAAGEYSWPRSLHLGVNVPVGEFQRGDLVFWANAKDGIHHVAIYLGRGMILAAPQTGEVVQVEPIFNQNEIIGGVRL